MDKDGKLRLELLNAQGKFLSEGVEVNLRHQVLSHSAVLSVNAARQVTIRGLFGAPQGLYRIEVDPPSYLPISQFINLHARGDGPANHFSNRSKKGQEGKLHSIR